MTVTRADFLFGPQGVLGELGRLLPDEPSCDTPVGRLALLTLSVNEYGYMSDFGARFNLIDTTMKEADTTFYNVNGGFPVLNYPSPEEGVRATAETLALQRYTSARRGLAANNAPTTTILIRLAQAALQALDDDGWGGINVGLVPQVQAVYDRVCSLVVSGGADVDWPTSPAPAPGPSTSSAPAPPKPEPKPEPVTKSEPKPEPKPPAPKPTEEDEDVLYISTNPNGGTGRFLVSLAGGWYAGIRNPEDEAKLIAEGAKRKDISGEVFAYLERRQPAPA